MRLRYLVLGIIVAGGGVWTWRSATANDIDPALLQGTGTIEVEEITIASQTGGTIAEIFVERGDQVKAGEELVRLDTDMLDIDLGRTASSVGALDAAREASYEAWQAALGLQSHPQEIDLKIAEVETQLEVAELQLELAQSLGNPAQLQIAQASRDGLREMLLLLEGMRAQPYAILTQVAQAEMIYRSLDSLQQIALGMQEMLTAQRGKMTLTAPRAGYVLDQTLSVGEVAAPLAPIVVIGDLEHVTLRVFLAESEYGRVRLGDRVDVTIDSQPQPAFLGQVVYISPRPEFTPATVQTADDRTRLVYAVEISLDNDDLALKPGMIADAAFRSLLPSVTG